MLNKKSTKRACQAILVVLAILVCPAIIAIASAFFEQPPVEGSKP